MYPILIKTETINPALEHMRKQVPCGDCPECINLKSSGWALRVSEELKHAHNAYFLTFTYDETTVPMVDFETGEFRRGKQDSKLFRSTLLKSDLQNTFKRYRRRFDRKYGKIPNKLQLKYYAVGEYGSQTQRPHYHAIVFNIDLDLMLRSWNDTKQKKLNGNIDVGTVQPQSIRYVTNYIISKGYYKYQQKESPFAIMSKGLGKKYVERMKKYHILRMDSQVPLENGFKIAMPRYLKEKIFDTDELMRNIAIINKAIYEEQFHKSTYQQKIAKRNRLRHKFENNKKTKL